jgi:hypothetical protein
LIVGAVVVAVVVRSRTQDDEHSVEHYHRQLHTLEELQSHPSTDRSNASGNESGNENANGNGDEDVPYPARAFRVSGSSAVRLTEPGHQILPPVPPPPVPNPGRPVPFEDDHGTDKDADVAESDDDKAAATFMTGEDDRAMHGINHRPRRLAGPALAVAAVLVLIIFLIVAGLHTGSPNHHGKSANTATTTHNHPRTAARHPATTTSTTAPPSVSTPQAATAHSATYQVSSASFALALSANGGDCWVEATSPTGSVLFTATLFPGQSHTITATGPVTVIAGAPGSFAATVNGAAVALPPGNQAPFTLHFQSATTAT